MQIRQVLTDPDFLKALNEANTSAARESEFKRLTDHAEKLSKNTKKAVSFDVGFEPIRAMHDSQYVIDFLSKITRQAMHDTSITENELIKSLKDFFSERDHDIRNTRCDYFPSLPTDGNALLWRLAGLLAPIWEALEAKKADRTSESIHPAAVLIPTLKKPGFPKGGRDSELYLKQNHAVILSETREYSISLASFLYRSYVGSGNVGDEKLNYYNPVKGSHQMLTDGEILRMTAAFLCYDKPIDDLLRREHRYDHTYLRLNMLRDEAQKFVTNNVTKEQYYAADLAYSEKLLTRPWLLNNLPVLFDMMGCLPPCEWDRYCDLVLKDKDIDAIAEDVKNPLYYTKDHNHNAAVLYFFFEVRKRKREHGYEYNNRVSQLLSFVSTSLADKLAYSKTNKEAAIVIAQSYLIEGRQFGEEFLEAYYVETKHKDLFPVVKEGKTGQIVEQICLLGKQPASVVTQGMFAGTATTTNNAPKVDAEPQQENNKKVAMKA